ncbi:DUF3048 domain-containing protein [Candidatus Microgenomates bacterium]|nr:DUF3048 domain-containing protein [Candidatus Microgenomates bacterium]
MRQGSVSSADTTPVVVDSNAPNADKEDTSGPRTEECPMNGVMYTKGQKAKWENRRPLLVAIENHTEARPQSGLSKADVVYEAVAEGGITRFLAGYYCQDAKPIGPVRSARIYFLKLVQGYGDHPLYAHVGGANTPGPANALGEIQDMGWEAYNDMNQFAVPFPYYYRDYERLPNRATEHTMYSSTPKLWEYAAKQRKLTEVDAKGKKWNASWTPWQFADDASVASRGTTAKIDYAFWSTNDTDNYKVAWTYDKATNSYARANGGTAHIDKDTDKQITSKNVVIAFAKESVANDGYDAGQHLLYGIIGSGEGLVFQNGKSIKVTWKKPTEEDMIRFYDPAGKEVKFVRGQIWVSVLPTGNKVNY